MRAGSPPEGSAELFILGALQSGFPLTPRPFRAVGEKLGLSETEVLRRLAALRRKGLIRRIGPVLDPEKVGRVGALAAMAVPANRLEEVAAAASACPSVTHNYERAPLDGRCPYNLWFTLTAPSQAALAEAVGSIEKATGLPVRVLPVRRKFKIGVRFDFSGNEREWSVRTAECTAAKESRPASRVPRAHCPEPPPSLSRGTRHTARSDESEIRDQRSHRGKPQPNAEEKSFRKTRFCMFVAQMDSLDREIIKELQDGLPLVREPYARVAKRVGISVETLLARLGAMLERGEVRRMGASIAHRRAGIEANVMCVWRVPPERVEAFAREAIALAAITHCYERATSPEWPYNVYCMIHGRKQADCEAVIRDLCQRTGQADFVALISTREFKKTWTRI